MRLLDAPLELVYQIVSIDLPEESQRHLSNLGIKAGVNLKFISKTATGGIVMVKSTRLAFDRSILQKIDVIEAGGQETSIPLSSLPVGAFSYVEGNYEVKEAKRRLMDMGLTRHTKIYLRKVAPLGDTNENRLRGYELTLRKSEAQMISVIPAEKKDEE